MSNTSTVDILIITFNRPAYTRLALARLLETCDDSCRVWVWHNGSDSETLEVARKYRDHPRVFQFHHSPENRKLREPTNWLLENATGDYLAKVDDDCLVPNDWIRMLRKAHEDEPRFGAIGCWHFMPEDFDSAACQPKIRQFAGGHQVVCHPWVGGSGFLLKRACVQAVGSLRNKDSGMTGYLTRVALKGWINGWYFPLLWQEHMDDPRAPHSLLKSDADLQRHLPLSAANFGASTLEQWDRQLRRSAAMLQRMPSDPWYFHPWRIKLRRQLARAERLFRSAPAQGMQT